LLGLIAQFAVVSILTSELPCRMEAGVGLRLPPCRSNCSTASGTPAPIANHHWHSPFTLLTPIRHLVDRWGMMRLSHWDLLGSSIGIFNDEHDAISWLIHPSGLRLGRFSARPSDGRKTVRSAVQGTRSDPPTSFGLHGFMIDRVDEYAAWLVIAETSGPERTFAD
jgi:hypothetical protein